MTLLPFLSAPLPIQVHAIAACLALMLGPVALYRRRRDRTHKVVGYIWVTAMAVLAISSFLIPSHFTPIGIGPLHGFAILTLWSLWAGINAAIARNIARHEAILRSLYSNGLIIAGSFTFLPGRTLNRMLFGEPSQLGWVVISALLGLVVLRVMLPRFRTQLWA
ncbi:DUF2306 domain-containing protein [Marivita sp.]|uniref:DUF2306 domain-containing protein n=1 Tax=Marivita sp. TaxID=2003365 RepID=UPI003F70E6A4